MSKEIKNKTKALPPDLLNEIRAGNQDVLNKLYRVFRGEFLIWAKRNFNVNKAEAADVFQETIIAFYTNVLERKLVHLEVPIKSYLYAIGKNKLINKVKANKKIILKEQFNESSLGMFDWELERKIEKTHRETQVSKTIRQLGDKCQQLLKLFYFNSFSHEAIAQRMGYSNEQTSRTMKKKCMKQFALLLNKKAL